LESREMFSEKLRVIFHWILKLKISRKISSGLNWNAMVLVLKLGFVKCVESLFFAECLCFQLRLTMFFQNLSCHSFTHNSSGLNLDLI
jgi:hypothetical protein